MTPRGIPVRQLQLCTLITVRAEHVTQRGKARRKDIGTGKTPCKVWHRLLESSWRGSMSWYLVCNGFPQLYARVSKTYFQIGICPQSFFRWESVLNAIWYLGRLSKNKNTRTITSPVDPNMLRLCSAKLVVCVTAAAVRQKNTADKYIIATKRSICIVCDSELQRIVPLVPVRAR